MGRSYRHFGICQWLINFIVSLLSRFGTRGSGEVPNGEDSSVQELHSEMTQIKPDSYSGSDMEVEFKHTDGSERWRQVDEHGDVNHSPEKGDLILNGDGRHINKQGMKKNGRGIDHLPRMKDGTDREGKGHLELETLTTKDDRGKVPVKSVVVTKESAREGQSKGATALTDEETREHNQHHEPRPASRLGPLLSVASNINEKSDAFINSRKKAMRRNYSPDS